MDQPFFEIVGAFVLWIFSGCKGKYQDRLGKGTNYTNAVFGLLMVLIVLALFIAVVRLFF